MAIERHTFDHVGIPTSEKHDGEIFVAPNRVWLTSPRDQPANIEWLRWEPDTQVPAPVRDLPHVAYRVADLDAALVGQELLMQPFEIGSNFARGAFILLRGGVVELMHYRNPDECGWF